MTGSSKTSNEHTLGEDLYLVHLQRTSAVDPNPEDAEDDHDYPHPRQSSKTIGEELFAVHLRRSQGSDPDYDVTLCSDNKKVHKNERECSYDLRSKNRPEKEVERK